MTATDYFLLSLGLAGVAGAIIAPWWFIAAAYRRAWSAGRPTQDPDLIDWGHRHGCTYSKQDDRWLEISDAAPLRKVDPQEVQRTDGDVVYLDDVEWAFFNTKRNVVEEHANDVLVRNREGQRFVAFTHGPIVGKPSVKTPGAQAVVAVEMEREVPFLLVMHKVGPLRLLESAESKLTSPPFDSAQLDFNIRYLVQGADEEFTRAFLNVENMDWLQQSPTFHVPGRGRGALVAHGRWAYFITAEPPVPDLLHDRLALVKEFTQRLLSASSAEQVSGTNEPENNV
ncbi:hypothetical protein [Natronoglycomyces albus]|uniref:DUF3137 domain-containing protein n=1 Tax=Natronoglycomyces albus TaxID=2811108 RepID=A0A895XTX1_9ACTN|nr:hypothetical protein [Natronoglycomyces albus]QSB06749.1 hypothetical protein JQS30_07635 [Natronoglycomyces albus]